MELFGIFKKKDNTIFVNNVDKCIDNSNDCIDIVPGSYRIRETYAHINISEPKVLSDILPNNSNILNIAEIWDGEINEAHLFIQKNDGRFILYESIFFNNSGKIESYKYIIKNSNSILDIVNEISNFCKIRYNDTMQFDFNQLINNDVVLSFLGF